MMSYSHRKSRTFVDNIYIYSAHHNYDSTSSLASHPLTQQQLLWMTRDQPIKLKDELKLVDETIRVGIQKASDASVQSHEDAVFKFAPVDRGRFQNHEHRKQAVKEQINRLKTRKIEDYFYKWNKDFIELSECLGIKAYI